MHAQPHGKQAALTSAPDASVEKIQEAPPCGADLIQLAGARMDAFHRLQRAFDAIGWNLHPLTGDSVIAVHRHWAVHHVCHDLHSAKQLLKRVGGLE